MENEEYQYPTQPKAIHIDFKDVLKKLIYSSHYNYWSEEGSKNHLREFLTDCTVICSKYGDTSNHYFKDCFYLPWLRTIDTIDTASQRWARWYAKEIAKSLSKYIYMKTDEVTE